jgi:hypothetical protein
MVLIGAGVVGVMVFHRVQARNEGNSAAAAAKAPVTKTSVTGQSAPVGSSAQPAAAITTPNVAAPTADAPSVAAPAPFELPATNQPIVVRKSGGRASRVGKQRGAQSETTQVAASPAVQPVTTPPAKTSTEVRANTPATKPSSPLSPQLIEPAKNTAAKGKVIQWP